MGSGTLSASRKSESKKMNLTDWLNLNPRHRVKISSDGCRVTAHLYGGEGLDQVLNGDGDDYSRAIESALAGRQAIKSVLP